jgi:hypothetical protein
MGSMPTSSSENSYDGSSVFRGKFCDVEALLERVLFLGSGNELIIPLSNKPEGLASLWIGGNCDPEDVRIADGLVVLGRLNSVSTSGVVLNIRCGSS